MVIQYYLLFEILKKVRFGIIMCLKESSVKLMEIQKFIESIIDNENNSDFPFINVDIAINDKKLQAGSLSSIISFVFDEPYLYVKTSLNFIMTFNDKMGCYNITVTESEEDGLKILYTHTSDDVEKLKDFSKLYIQSIIVRAMMKISDQFYKYTITG